MNSAFKIFYTVLLISISPGVFAQEGEKNAAVKSSPSTKKKKNSPWLKRYIAVNADFAFGEFSTTHFLGIGASYAITLNQENDVINWAFDAGVTYYLGKKEKINQYSYKYPGFTFIHIMGGTHFWVSDFNVRLLAGPALGVYNGNTKFNIGGRLEVNYEAKPQFIIGPVLNMMLEPGNTSLWSAGIKATIQL